MGATKIRKQSPLQEVCLEYGRHYWRVNNTYEFGKLLRELGLENEAALLVEIRLRAHHRAKEVYYQKRKLLQPDWEPDWVPTLKQERVE